MMQYGVPISEGARVSCREMYDRVRASYTFGRRQAVGEGEGGKGIAQRPNAITTNVFYMGI